MIRIYFIYFLLLLLCLDGCFPLTGNALKKININDNELGVKKKLGSPYTQKIYYNKKYLVYYIHDDLFSIFFNLKKFPFVGFYPLLRTGEEYWVILENDRVVSVGSSSNFKNSIPRALTNTGSIVDVEVR